MTASDPSSAARRLSLLLPPWAAFGAQRLSEDIARAFGRADALDAQAPGRIAQWQRHVTLVPSHWAPAAVTRQVDAGDAADALWLRADPAHVRPDINGARLLASGERLGTTQQDVDALLPALKPVFGDAGVLLDAPHPARWYLRLQPGSELPPFSEPDDALGEDIFDHQPQGPAARRWRALLNEAQIVLHNHPWNAQRQARGLAPINALWVWGAGRLPNAVRSAAARIHSDRDLPLALARLAGVQGAVLPATLSTPPIAGDLYDLTRSRDLAALQRDWLRPALATLGKADIAEVLIDSADGSALSLRAGQRWRFWRKPWAPVA